MTDHPILFSGPMIRALLDGRKTQTRRVLKQAPQSIGDKVDAVLRWRVGDRLWVRERVYADRMVNILTGERSTNAIVAYYHADDTEVCERLGFNLGWEWERLSLPSIHMPRYFSRLTLIVESVRVERLQDIAEADADAEGVDAIDGHFDEAKFAAHAMALGMMCEDGRTWFAWLWDSINGPGSWESNPWVAVITFRVVRANIDALTADGRQIHEDVT